MDRRKFILKSSASTAFMGLGGISLNSCTVGSGKHLTILHTNDVHSHIDVFPRDHSEYPNLGGLARRAKLIENIRQENPNTLLFDAGDIFQGTPYFNFYGGELEFRLMSKLGYDAATIGNHDFDNGIKGLLAQFPYAKFKLLNANYDFTHTVLDGYIKPFEIYPMNGLKVGVYGLGIDPTGLVEKKLYGEMKYLNPYEIAMDMENHLKNSEHCDLIICISHIGYAYANENRPSDLLLASRTMYTDLIIGGHTHTFLEKPTVVRNKMGHNILVNQVGCFGLNLGRIDFYFDHNKNKTGGGASIKV